MKIQEWYYLFASIGAIIGMIFSGFMMYSMYKVNKGVKNVSQNMEKFTEEIQNAMASMLGGGNRDEMLMDASEIIEPHEQKYGLTINTCVHDFKPVAGSQMERCSRCGVFYNVIKHG